MSLSKFTTKDPDEILQYSFDFNLVIPNVTETIGTMLWEIIDQTDVSETNISAMLVTGTSSTASKICSQFVQGGTSGKNYVLSCEVTTNTNEVVKLAGVLPVKTFK